MQVNYFLFYGHKYVHLAEYEKLVRELECKNLKNPSIDQQVSDKIAALEAQLLEANTLLVRYAGQTTYVMGSPVQEDTREYIKSTECLYETQ